MSETLSGAKRSLRGLPMRFLIFINNNPTASDERLGRSLLRESEEQEAKFIHENRQKMARFGTEEPLTQARILQNTARTISKRNSVKVDSREGDTSGRQFWISHGKAWCAAIDFQFVSYDEPPQSADQDTLVTPILGFYVCREQSAFTENDTVPEYTLTNRLTPSTPMIRQQPLDDSLAKLPDLQRQNIFEALLRIQAASS